MNAEITDNTANNSHGWVFYDGECVFCVRGLHRWGRVFARRGFAWVPLQAPGSAARVGVSESALLTEMHLLLPDGGVRSGVAAWSLMCRTVWWLWPLGALLTVPGFRQLACLFYRWLARNRHCLGGTCAVPKPRRQSPNLVDGLILLALPLIASSVTWERPAWIFMWSLGVSLGMAGKWIVWRATRRAGTPTGPTLTLGWFLAWPGMDGRAFFDSSCRVVKPTVREWLGTTVKLGFGGALIWVGVPLAEAVHPLFAGWLGMIGIVYCLHFGSFHLLSILWRSAGVDAAPIMRSPIRATSLAEFWGERWNTAFSIPARRLILKPLARFAGLKWAAFGVFAASGLIHELVISVPAGGGYGFPTAYFAVQGLGLLAERSALGRMCGLGTGWRGWVFTLLVTAGPAFWLFHPTFVRNVILPMLDTIGAL